MSRSSIASSLFLTVLLAFAAKAQAQNTWTHVPASSQVDDFAIDGNNCFYESDRLAGFARSCDQGKTWKALNNGITTPACMAWTLQYDPVDRELIGVLLNSDYKGASCGATRVTYWRLPENSSTWIQIPQPKGFYTRRPAQSGDAMPLVKGQNLVLGGFGASGYTAMYSTDGGVTTHLSKEPSGLLGSFEGAYTVPQNGHVLVGTEDGGLFESRDGGATINNVWPWMGGADPGNGETLGLATNCNGNIITSSNYGVWIGTGAYPSYSWKFVLRTNARLRSVFRDPSCNLFIGQHQRTSNPTIQRSTDGGLTWTPFYTGIPANLEAWHFVFNPADGKDYVVVENGTTNAGWVYSIPQ